MVSNGVVITETTYFTSSGKVRSAGGDRGFLELTIKDVLNQGNNKNGEKADVMTANYTYECKVTIRPSGQELTKVTKLIVFEKPTITSRDKDITHLNTDTSFTCVARGKLVPTITWSVLLMSGTTAKITSGLDTQVNGLQTTSKYTKKNFQATDVGIYACKASNGVGSVSADVIVQLIRCDVGCVSDERIAIEITNLTYTSDYENVNSNKYIGLKKPSRKRSGSVIAIVKITYERIVDKPRQPLLDAIKTGTFAGYPVRKEFVSPTSARPTIKRSPVDKYITNRNTEISFTCVAEGKPAPAITWTHTSMTSVVSLSGVSKSDGQDRTISTYNISSFKDSDIGIYNCTATNEAGSVSAVATAQYAVRPNIIRAPEDKYIINRNTEISFTCVAEGSPEPTITWTHTNVTSGVTPLSGVSKPDGRNRTISIYTISSFKDSDIGTYTCTATNKAGNVSAAATAQYAARPSIKRSPVDKYITNRNAEIYFTCVAEGKPAPAVTWSRTSLTSGVSSLSGVSKPDGLNRTIGMYTISSFKVSDIGIYNCTATNKAGSVSAVVIAQYIGCNKGCSTDDKIAIEMTDLTYSSDYESEHSGKYKELKHAIERECFAVYARATQNIFSCIVTRFRPGSVISHIRMTYPSDTNEPRKPLQTAIKSGMFADHTVRTSFVSSKASRASASVFLFTISPVKSSAAIMFIQAVASVIMMHLMCG